MDEVLFRAQVEDDNSMMVHLYGVICGAERESINDHNTSRQLKLAYLFIRGFASRKK